jgi:hypothetical protein
MPAHGDPRAELQLKSGLELADSHFDWMAHHFRFAALHTLSLSNMVIAVSSLTAFLKTAQPTLHNLSIKHLHWANERVFERTWPAAAPAGLSEEGERVCGQIRDYLRYCFSLQSLCLQNWYYQGISIQFLDPSDARWRRLRSDPSRKKVHALSEMRYGKERAPTFKGWIDQVICDYHLLTTVMVVSQKHFSRNMGLLGNNIYRCSTMVISSSYLDRRSIIFIIRVVSFWAQNENSVPYRTGPTGEYVLSDVDARLWTSHPHGMAFMR